MTVATLALGLLQRTELDGPNQPQGVQRSVSSRLLASPHRTHLSHAASVVGGKGWPMLDLSCQGLLCVMPMAQERWGGSLFWPWHSPYTARSSLCPVGGYQLAQSIVPAGYTQLLQKDREVRGPRRQLLGQQMTAFRK